MTNKSSARKSYIRYIERAFAPLPSFLYLCGIIILALFVSKDASVMVKDGMRLAALCVIPSSFSFMILSDFYTQYGKPERIRVLSIIFTSVFGIDASGLGAFVCGNLSGFPIGMKMSADLSERKILDSDEATLLSAISNNPSIPFILGAVGEGMYGSRKIGLILLFSLYLSVLLTGLIFRRRKKRALTPAYESDAPSFNLVESISNAATSSVCIGGFIMFFSVVVGLLQNSKVPIIAKNIISSFVEITNAAKHLSVSFRSLPIISIAITGFAVGFGGLSVILQSAYFCSGSNIKVKKHVFIKLTEGLICAIISALTFILTAR